MRAVTINSEFSLPRLIHTQFYVNFLFPLEAILVDPAAQQSQLQRSQSTLQGRRRSAYTETSQTQVPSSMGYHTYQPIEVMHMTS